MPVYNTEKYVGASIESHLRQTYTDFELIITDNGSTDRSPEICQSYAARDSRVKYFRNSQNLGATANYRRCFELSAGEYFRWTPADDLVSPNLLQRAVAVLDADPSIFVAYPRTKLIDASGAFLSDFVENLETMDELPSRRWQHVQRNVRLGNLHYGLCRSHNLKKTGLLRNYTGGDFPLLNEMSLYGKIFEIPDAFFYRRMHEAASSAMKTPAEVMALYDPTKRETLLMCNWFQFSDNLKSVARGPIPFSEKLRIYVFLARWTFWGRRAYLKELADAASFLGRKLKNRVSG